MFAVHMPVHLQVLHNEVVIYTLIYQNHGIILHTKTAFKYVNQPDYFHGKGIYI